MRYASLKGCPHHHSYALKAQTAKGLNSPLWPVLSQGYQRSTMTQKNIKYYFLECNMSIEQIAEKTGLPVDTIKALLVNPPVYIPEYQPRQRQQYKPF
jgi:hypothetical protein